VASQPPTAKYPYGRGRAETLSAIIVAAMLFAAAGLIAIQSVHQIRTPHQAPAAFTLIVLVAVVVIKESLFRFVLTVGEGVQSTAIRADAWHHRSDAITSAAAFVGICIALWGGKGWETADDWAALFACVIIAFNGFGMFTKALGDVMDAAAPEKLENEIRGIALAVPGVRELDKVRVRKSGLSHLVDIQVRVEGTLSVREGHAIAHAVKDALTASAPHSISDVTVHIEPIG